MGSISKISYKDWFSRYKDILIQRWTSQRIDHVVKLMNHYIFGAPDSQTLSDGATGNLEATIDTTLAQLDLGFDDDSDLNTNDLYSARLPAAAADWTVGPGPVDKFMNNRLAGSEPVVVHAPTAAAATNPELAVVGDPLSALTVEIGSTSSRAKKGGSKRGKTQDSDGMVARRSARTQGEK